MAKKKPVEPRVINMICLHCSDSDNPNHDDISVIRQWHTERGWTGPDGIEGTEDDVGYHEFIKKDGTVQFGRDISQVGAGVKGHNAHALHICLSGKLRSQFTRDQFRSLRRRLDHHFKTLNLDWKSVRLHNQLDSNKTCPNFTMEDAVSG